jgi:hypothetical protein
MRLIGRIFAIVLVLVIPVLLMAASCNLAIYNTMSNEQTYREAFADRSLLNDITPFAALALFATPGNPAVTSDGGLSMDRVISTIGVENWNAIVTEIVPATWMQNRFDQILRLFTGILQNDYSALDETVDVESLQARFEGDSVQDLASRIVKFAPACTPEQEELIRTFETDATSDFPLCNTSDEALQALSLSHVTTWLSSVGKQLQSVTATQFFDLTSTEARGLHVILKLDEQSSYVSYLCPGALLALIVFFTVRSFRSFGRWIGGTLLLSGIGVLVALVAMQFFLVGLLREAARAMNDSERLFTQIVMSLVRTGMGGISQSMLLQAGLMILAGFGLFGLTYLVARSEFVATGATVFVTEDGQVISSTSLPSIPIETGSTSRNTPVE